MQMKSIVSRQEAISLKGIRYVLWIELLLSAAAGLLLWYIAQPLAEPGIDLGLGRRYAGVVEPFTWTWVKSLLIANPWQSLPNDIRAVALLRTAGYWLPALAAIGWLALTVARTGERRAMGLVLFFWSSMGWLLRPFGWASFVWLGLGLAGLLMSVAALWIYRNTRPHLASATDASLWSVWAWPGWILLSGFSWLFVADFAARGPISVLSLKPGARYFGLHQADGLWLANGTLLFAALWRAQIIMAVIKSANALAQLWKRPRGPALLIALGGILALALGILGHNANYPLNLGIAKVKGAGMPHISGEILRLLACIALAWFAYRIGEWGATAPRIRRGLGFLVLSLVLIGLGLATSDDKGPGLVLLLAGLLLAGVPLLHRLLRSTARTPYTALGLLLAGALTVGAVGLWRTVVSDWAPQFSNTAALREFARDFPFRANSPNLAQARWLIDDAPAGGYGLARVPYCGARAHIEAAGCTLGSGAPIQLASDFAYAGLAATWGMGGSGMLILLLLAWLCAMPLSALAALKHAGQAPSWALLHVWLVAIPSLAAQAQTLISVGATMTLSSLTGVTLPVLGYGSMALCTIGLWVGLAANPVGTWRRPGAK